MVATKKEEAKLLLQSSQAPPHSRRVLIDGPADVVSDQAKERDKENYKDLVEEQNGFETTKVISMKDPDSVDGRSEAKVKDMHGEALAKDIRLILRRALMEPKRRPITQANQTALTQP